ncbi:probable 28S ribosomal protein S26, mitochondrial [Dermacentor silvarum]|uniref:probable 28S ribosomal protein S26, mitochondrial n=1 Tax=Dermacentor silvarum TaxID=543639 RepID=UPI001898E350|nr:probable 28S ribosomal protein S26, mitochondrial [Dermacentor silvarum]
MLASVLARAALSPLRSAAYDPALHRPDVSLLLGLQQVRWKKKPKGSKPRWMPIAPSKLFRINLGPPKDPEELAVLRRMHAAYKTEMKAIRNFWGEQHLKDLEQADKHSAISQEEEREHERLLEENEKENQRVALLRMERNKLEEAKRVEELMQREADAKAKLAQLKEQVDEIVRLEKERSSTYVTLENLDEVIEFAIENPISYSYAIDPQGKEIWEGTPHYELYKQGPAHAYALPVRKQF